MPLPGSPIVVGLGELLWDDFPEGRHPGGAPANVAFQAQQLGARGIVISRVGSDSDGDGLLEFLASKQLDTNAIQRDPIHPTGRVTVSIGEDGQPRYQIHEPVAWDFLERNPALDGLLARANAVCYGTLAQRHAQSRATIQSALGLTSSECLRVYDINLRQHFYSRELIEASLTHAVVVKLNDEEVRILAELFELPKEERAFAERVLERWSTKVVCVTRGARGCLVVAVDEVHDVPGRAVKIADTVGAGDAFTAGFIIARLRGWPLGVCAEFANRVGGLVASRRGAMPDLVPEFQQLLAQYD